MKKIKFIKLKYCLLMYLNPPSIYHVLTVYLTIIKSDKNFTVYNFNSYQSLPPELSTSRCWNAMDLNYEIVDALLAKKFKRDIINDDKCYGFNLLDNNIFVGVDYNYLDKEKTPLIIKAYKKAINKKVVKENFKSFKEDEATRFQKLEKFGTIFDTLAIISCQSANKQEFRRCKYEFITKIRIVVELFITQII